MQQKIKHEKKSDNLWKVLVFWVANHFLFHLRHSLILRKKCLTQILLILLFKKKSDPCLTGSLKGHHLFYIDLLGLSIDRKRDCSEVRLDPPSDNGHSAFHLILTGQTIAFCIAIEASTCGWCKWTWHRPAFLLRGK